MDQLVSELYAIHEDVKPDLDHKDANCQESANTSQTEQTTQQVQTPPLHATVPPPAPVNTPDVVQVNQQGL